MKKLITLLLAVLLLVVSSAYADGTLVDADKAYVKRNYSEALTLYKAYALIGNAIAQFNLGLMYDKGQGVTQDYAEAVRWYKLAAEQGNINAQYDLGGKYLLGFGVAQDYVMAYMWYNLAARTGDKDAVANRDIVANKLTPQQLLEAQKLARECLARNYKGC